MKLEIERALNETAPDLLEVDIEGMAEQVEATAKAASVLGKMNTPSRKYHPHFKCMYLRLLVYLLHRFVPPQVRVIEGPQMDFGEGQRIAPIGRELFASATSKSP